MFGKKLIVITLVILCSSTCFAQRPDPNSPRVKAVRAFQELLEHAGDEIDQRSAQLLADDKLTELKEQVEAIREHTSNRSVSDVMIENGTTGTLVYELRDKIVTVTFQMTTSEPIRINAVSFKTEGTNSGNSELRWETLESQIDQAAKDGFEGAVLVTRDGEIAFQKAYGWANREKKIRNSNDTVFAIGSAPIDFTHAGILILKDQGKLNLDDPITRFFDLVPDDKKQITIEHLMTGRSGLPDFHDIPEDKNPDHTWIDRDEAVKRIMAQKLLFNPGDQRKHSHSAWGLLAAIIEIASGETYQQFTIQRLYKPAGMTNTGFFGDEVPEERIAVGYGFRNSAEPNSPPHWGKTSWLVMGSGGQISTLGDMLRWDIAMYQSDILSPESKSRFLRTYNGISADGDMFGFEFMHSHNPKQMFLIISNTINSREKRQKFNQLARALTALVRDAGAPAKFSLGIAMRVSSDDGVFIDRVVAGSAAEKDGLKAGDQLVSAGGTRFGEPRDVLGPYLRDGTPIDFEIKRDGETMKIRVKPLAIK